MCIRDRASECLCAEGHAVAASDLTSTCAPCSTGTYKSFVGNNSCVPCPLGTDTEGTGATTGNACRCPVGHVLADAGCQPCPPHHDTWKNTCRQCPVNSGNDTPGSACECDAGYTTGVTVLCTACTPGKYKSSRGQQICSECPEHTLSAPAATLPDQCLCAPGFERSVSSACTPCTENSFCPGRELKLKCTEHSSSPAGSAERSDCQCLPGFFLSDNKCLECGENFFCMHGIRTPCPMHSNSQRMSSMAQNCTCVSGFAEVSTM